MSEPGKTCLWTVRPGTSWPWCGARGVAAHPVPPRDGRPGYDLTVCTEHNAAYHRGEREPTLEPAAPA